MTFEHNLTVPSSSVPSPFVPNLVSVPSSLVPCSPVLSLLVSCPFPRPNPPMLCPTRPCYAQPVSACARAQCVPSSHLCPRLIDEQTTWINIYDCFLIMSCQLLFHRSTYSIRFWNYPKWGHNFKFVLTLIMSPLLLSYKSSYLLPRGGP